MKNSKSILIFLFLSSVSGAFFYALDRTNGNVFKSLQFTLYFLAIKIGLIGPNLPLKLDHHQPNQQLVSRVGYNPYVSVLYDYHPSGLLMETVRFELELKHHQTRLVQDYLFQNQLDMFEHHLVIQYFEYWIIKSTKELFL